jgi:hypothetical protein
MKYCRRTDDFDRGGSGAHHPAELVEAAAKEFGNRDIFNACGTSGDPEGVLAAAFKPWVREPGKSCAVKLTLLASTRALMGMWKTSSFVLTPLSLPLTMSVLMVKRKYKELTTTARLGPLPRVQETT